MSLCDIFDTYGRRARLLPALLTLFPVLSTVALWSPVLYDFIIVISALGTACGVSLLLAHIARYLGRKAEPKLYCQWGGKPTSQWLLRSDGNLDEQTKARYRRRLEEHVEGWQAPSQADEESDRKGAMATYDSAVRWLRDRTRDRRRFHLVFAENVSYGFRRNLFGLRWGGRLVALLCVAVNCGSLYHWTGVTGGSISVLGIASLGFSVGMTAVWFAVVKQQWVRDAADGYARALLEACDSDGLR